MQLRIYGKNTKVARYELRLATEIMLAHLLSSRMLPHISIYIRQKPHLTCVGEPSLGLLYGRNRRFPPRDFTIWLNTTYTRRIQLRTLGHELAHLKQYALGECRTLDNGTVKWHRFKGGIHAPHNNTMWAGRSMVTGHLHSLKVIPFTDYNGTRYGVDSGCLAIPTAAQFSYCEDNPLNWRSGFVVLTFRKGVLMFPELVMVHDEPGGVVQFRGDLISV